MSGKQEGCSSRCSQLGASVSSYAKKAVVEYIQEFKTTDEQATRDNQAAADKIREAVAKHAIVLLVEPAGVAEECNAAVALVKATRVAEYTVIDVFDHEETALRAILGKQALTLPVVFIQGRLVGGLPELYQLNDNQGWSAQLSVSREELKTLSPELLEVQREPLHLVHQAGGGPWWFFHLFMYGNVVRMISFFQVCIAIICCICIANDEYKTAQSFATYFFFDCLLLLAFGPSPWSPTGLLSTLLVWNRRGPVVTALPYKVIFAFYAVLIGRLAMKTHPFGSDDASDKFDSQGEFVTIAINSTLLTVLRF